MATDERMAENLRGPVRRVETTFSGGGGSFCEYDESGRFAARGMRNPDGTVFRTIYFYDDVGRLTRTESEHERQRYISARYVYDGAGRLVRIEQQRPDGAEAQPTIVRATAGGGRIEIETIELPKAAEGAAVGYDITKIVPGARTRTTEYGPDNRKLSVSFHDEEHNLLSSMGYVYDDAGRLTEENQTWGRYNPLGEIMKLSEGVPEAVRGVLAGIFGDGAKGFHTTYQYDELGRQIERRTDQGPFGAGSVRTEYNERGDVSRTTQESNRQELHVGPNGVEPEELPSTISVTEFEYVYDSYRNWTSRTMRTPTTDTAAPWVTNVETRRIEYFE